jgi:hypothetical protein
VRKVYVSVTVEYAADGTAAPLSFVWDDGRRYDVDRLIDVRHAPSLKAGGSGMRYTIRVCGKETHLWFDDFERRWFMEGK